MSPPKKKTHHYETLDALTRFQQQHELLSPPWASTKKVSLTLAEQRHEALQEIFSASEISLRELSRLVDSLLYTLASELTLDKANPAQSIQAFLKAHDLHANKPAKLHPGRRPPMPEMLDLFTTTARDDDSQRPVLKPGEERYRGEIRHIQFHNAETGFCVLNCKTLEAASDIKANFSIAAVLPSVYKGEIIDCVGVRSVHARHGLQIKASEALTLPPTQEDALAKYLGSGAIPGIGPVLGKKLAETFGPAVFEIAEGDWRTVERTHEISRPRLRLQDVHGLGKVKAAETAKALAAHRQDYPVIRFLQSLNFTPAKAAVIYKTLGPETEAIVRYNPYRMFRDVPGVGFKSADEAAKRLGVAPDDDNRLRAGAIHVLNILSQFGHTASPMAVILPKMKKELGVDDMEKIKEALKTEAACGDLFAEKTIGSQDLYYLKGLYKAEVETAERLKVLLEGPLPWGNLNVDAEIALAEQTTGLTLSASQRIAVQNALQSKVCIITGGPGVGKTTIVNTILKIIARKLNNILLAAPTGKAAKRMTETTGTQAKTIHRTLKVDPENREKFIHNKNQPLETGFIIVDEVSMLDIVLSRHLLIAVPDNAAILFVGDVDQLPSVGPGSVLGDMIRSAAIPVSRLTEIHRQAEGSTIITNAHRINRGEMPDLSNSPDGDFFFFPVVGGAEKISEMLLDVVKNRLPQKFGFNPNTDIQVLTPMNVGNIGTYALNAKLQAALNTSAGDTASRYIPDSETRMIFKAGDRVIQLSNNYELGGTGVFNGDLGTILEVIDRDKIIKVLFDGEEEEVDYPFAELESLSLAYACTIHKFQGSEFPCIVIPVSLTHERMLYRNLLYTGITRGKKIVVLVGEKAAIAKASENIDPSRRTSLLAERVSNVETDWSESRLVSYPGFIMGSPDDEYPF